MLATGGIDKRYWHLTGYPSQLPEPAQIRWAAQESYIFISIRGVFRLPIYRTVTFRQPATNTNPVECAFFTEGPQARERAYVPGIRGIPDHASWERGGHLLMIQSGDRDEFWIF